MSGHGIQEHQQEPASDRWGSALRTWLTWTAGFLAFPIAGLAGTAAAGRVDSPVAALLGGAITTVRRSTQPVSGLR
jgi:hypothetical protein